MKPTPGMKVRIKSGTYAGRVGTLCSLREKTGTVVIPGIGPRAFPLRFFELTGAAAQAKAVREYHRLNRLAKANGLTLKQAREAVA